MSADSRRRGRSTQPPRYAAAISGQSDSRRLPRQASRGWLGLIAGISFLPRRLLSSGFIYFAISAAHASARLL